MGLVTYLAEDVHVRLSENCTVSFLQHHSGLICLTFQLHQINLCLTYAHGFNVRHSRMLLPFEYGVNLLQGAAFSLNPIYSLWKEKSALVQNRPRMTYYQDEYKDVPRPVDHVHLPTNLIQPNWHDEDQ